VKYHMCYNPQSSSIKNQYNEHIIRVATTSQPFHIQYINKKYKPRG
jgi:hypothetical protein